MKRYGAMLRLKPGAEEQYKQHHKAAQPEVLRMIAYCYIRNYSIYLKDGFLFGYFEYHGADFAADMQRMAADPKTQESQTITMPLQGPLSTRKGREWWAEMDEVFHVDQRKLGPEQF